MFYHNSYHIGWVSEWCFNIGSGGYGEVVQVIWFPTSRSHSGFTSPCVATGSMKYDCIMRSSVSVVIKVSSFL